MADTLVRSRLVPAKTAEEAFAILQKGRELNMPPMEAFELLTVIQGKATVSPKGQLALIHRSGQLEKMDVQDDGDTCTVTMIRRGGSTHTTTFSMEDAQVAGLLANTSWKKYPANMRRWRAIGYCADVLFPDVTGGMYRPEELGTEVNEDGAPVTIDAEVIATPVDVVESPPVDVKPAPPVEVDDHTKRLLALYKRSVPAHYTAQELKDVVKAKWGLQTLKEMTAQHLDEWEEFVGKLDLEAEMSQADQELAR